MASAARRQTGPFTAAVVASPLELVVDSEVHLPATAPRRLLLALRRQLRRHDFGRLLEHDQGQRALLGLLKAHGDHHSLPQALLSQLASTCQRHGIAYAVTDRRSMVACAPLRHRVTLSEAQESALRRLLLRDNGVLVAPEEGDRWALSAELITRRQQRTLLLTVDGQRQRRWRSALQEALDLPGEREVTGLSDALPASRVVVASYEALTPGTLEKLRRAFGLVVFDAVDEVDAISLIRVVRTLESRYLLGLAADATRVDGLHGPLQLVLGGIAHELAAPAAPRALRLSQRSPATAYRFDYAGRQHYQALLAALAADGERTAQIAQDIAQEAAQGSACLVLSERRDHLTNLREALPDGISAEIVSSDVRPGERAELVARFARGELTVLLATGQIALESIKAPCLSRLFVTFPFSHGQKLERISELLLTAAPGKRDAIVFDYDDVHVAPLHRAHQKRAKVIERLQKQSEQAYQKWAQLSLGF